MCFEYEPDRHVRDDEQEQAREEIRRLFERYRAAGRSEAATKHVAGVRAPDTVEEQEQESRSRRWHRAEPARVRAAGDPGGRPPLAGAHCEVDPWRPRSTLVSGAVMAKDDIGLIEPDEIAYRLELTPSELKLTYSALKALLNDFGHDEHTFS
jgi:hypothetical protein